MKTSAWCLGALAILVAHSAAAQQVSAEFTGLGGLYMPVADVFEVDQDILDELGALLGVELDEWTGKHKAGFAAGGRLSLWFTQAFGVEGSFIYAFADGEMTISGSDAGTPFTEIADTSAHVWLAGLKGVYRFRPQESFRPHIGGGLAVIGHGGTAYDYLSDEFGADIEGTTDIGLVIDLGATFDLGRQVAIRIDAEDYIYAGKFDVAGATVDITKSKLQNDLMFTGGITIRLGG